MDNRIESLLISGIFETKDKDDLFSVTSLVNGCKLVLENKDTFDAIPEKVFIELSSLQMSEDAAGSSVGLARDLETDFGKNNFDKVQFFSNSGVLLYDGLHASAFGRFNYIYRAKGLRIYLFQNSTINIVAPYCTIDHHGFIMSQEEVYEMDLDAVKTRDDVNSLLCYLKDPNENSEILYSHKVLTLITNLKAKFTRDFFLEYLLLPPDVDQLSSFSTDLRKQLWHVCISEDFLKKWGEEIQGLAMKLLARLEIFPTTEQLLGFITKDNNKQDLKQILERINTLEENVVGTIKSEVNKSQDIIEVKPNIAGIGFNLNEVHRRLFHWLTE